ncbi:MAG: ABC-type branched-chain amino acid transport system periplasmic component-like protein [Actinomycetia bacterium]|nr:ABC-type branched-chain amino acid transport system periplasmic component-like protein [Actinomycetes bacterium]
MNVKVVAVLAAVALLAAGYTGSKADAAVRTPRAEGTTSAPKTSTTTGVTATEIKVSALGYKPFYGDSLIGAQARFKRENDAGGVNGRKIVLTDFNDDNQTAASDVTVARKVVEQDKPFAIVPVMTAAFSAADYLNQKHVPFLGWGITPDWCNKNAGFSITACPSAVINPSVSDFVPVVRNVFPDGVAKGKAIALIGADGDSAKIALQGFADNWLYNGARVVYKNNAIPLPPIVVSDYTPYAQHIMATNGGKGPDLVMAVSSVTDGIGIAKKLREIGYTKQILEFSLYDPRIASQSKNIYNEISFAPWQQTSGAPVAQMIKDVDAINPTAPKGLALEAGYWSADLFIQLLKKTGKNLTQERFLQVANHNFTYDNGGGSPPLAFPRSHTEGSTAIAVVFGTGTTYTITAPLTPMRQIPKRAFQRQLKRRAGK